jgi:4-hydroxybenzoate polyprenyltransferase
MSRMKASASHASTGSTGPTGWAGRIEPAPGVLSARTLRLAWIEARPAVQMVFLLRFLTALALAEPYVAVPAWSVVAGAASWSCAIAAIYLLNGVSDVSADRANGSTRPVASGRLDVTTALQVAGWLALASLVLGALAPWPAVLLATLVLGLGWAYSMPRKALKNSTAGFMTAVVGAGLLTYLAGWIVSGRPPNAELLVFALAMSAWMGLGGSTKDLSDVEGDRTAGRRTWPIVLGERWSRVSMAISALAVGCGFCVAAATVAPDLITPGAVVLAGSAVLIAMLVTPLSHGTRSTRRRPYRVFMVTQYTAHLTFLGRFALQF